jgi:hypothetical protein
MFVALSALAVLESSSACLKCSKGFIIVQCDRSLQFKVQSSFHGLCSMTVAVKDPDTKQTAPDLERTAALERAYEAEVPAAAVPSHKKQAAEQNGARQEDRKSRKVTTILVVVGVVAVIIALVAGGWTAAQVGVTTD